MISKKIKIFLIFLLIGVFGVFIYFMPTEMQEKKYKANESETFLLEYELKEVSLPSVYISSNSLEQGDTLFIKINDESIIDRISGEFGSVKIDFFKPITNGKQEQVGILGIPVKQNPGKYTLVIHLSKQQTIEKEINIIKREFPVTELLVTEELKEKGFTSSKIVENILDKENLAIGEILSIYTPKAYFNKAFINPLTEMKDVGAFGNIRKSEDADLQHLGVDLQADTGTPVYAINNGVVHFSQELTNYGKTLIIDHGLGIFSLYLHLDKFKVLSGQTVERGDIISFSGNTGYSIAPHLHFSVKVNGASVDPLRFIEVTKKELKEEITEKEQLLQKKSPLVIDRILEWGHYAPKNPRSINTIIIHSSYDALSNNPYSVDGIIYEYKIYGVSPHYLIDRNGTILRLVKEEDIAYHAGKSEMPDGRTDLNNFSIGIELINTKIVSPNEAQYSSLVELIKSLKLKYGIKNILGHNDIPPERKTDPCNFDWQKFNEMLKN